MVHTGIGVEATVVLRPQHVLCLWGVTLTGVIKPGGE